MSEKDERPLAVRLREAAHVVTDRIAKRNKKLKQLRDKDRRNAYVMYLMGVEAHQDSIAMVEFVDFLNQENRFLRHELNRMTNNSAWLDSGLMSIDGKSEKVEQKEGEKDEREVSTSEPTKTVRVGGQELETATRMPTIEKRDVDTGE